MPGLIVFQASADLPWAQIGSNGSILLLIALLLLAAIRVGLVPAWKEIRLKQLEVRQAEVATKEKEAEALGALGASLASLASVLQSVAIEQRRATESLEILQRVNMDRANQDNVHLNILAERVKQIEERHAQS